MTRIDYYNDPQAPAASTIIPAASAIITRRGKILLVRRRDNGLWALPGGTMEIGESISQTVIREVKEETGLDVVIKRLVGIYSDPHHIIAYSDGEVRQQFNVCFACIEMDGELQTDSESDTIGFFSIKQIEQMDIHQATFARIQSYFANKKNPFIY